MENENIENNQPLGAYLGSAIRQLRSRHGLTIADVADRAGISRGMLSKIENAQTATSLETLAQIAVHAMDTLTSCLLMIKVPKKHLNRF
jgi:transcriptional regulator with XRE-family HTH domain